MKLIRSSSFWGFQSFRNLSYFFLGNANIGHDGVQSYLEEGPSYVPFLLNTTVNRPLNASAFSRSKLVTPLPLLFSILNTFFLTIDLPKHLWFSMLSVHEDLWLLLKLSRSFKIKPFHCCLVVTWRERADLLALVCDVCLICYFPIWYLGTGVILACIDFWSFLSFLLRRLSW